MQNIVKTTLVACLMVIGVDIRPAFAAPHTDDTLKTMIDNLGYTSSVTTQGTTKSYWIPVTLPDNSYTVQTYLQLSSDKTELWIVASLSKIPQGKSVPPSVLQGMLVENDTITPKSFSLGKTNNTFYLNMRVRNDNVTPALLRQSIDSMTAILTQTESLWATDKWPAH